MAKSLLKNNGTLLDQLSAISYQLSAISYQLSAISYQLFADGYRPCCYFCTTPKLDFVHCEGEER